MRAMEESSGAARPKAIRDMATVPDTLGSTDQSDRDHQNAAAGYKPFRSHGALLRHSEQLG